MTSEGAAASRPRASAWLGMLRAVPWREGLLVLAGFGLMSIVISWPLLTDFGSAITGGGGGGDPSGYVWDLWYNAEHGLGFWGTTTQELVSAPFGRVSPSAVNVTLLVTVGPGWVIASLFGPVVAYNTLALAGLTLSASAMYLLIRWLGLGVAPAIWAGAAFMIFPYEQLRSVAHIPLNQLWCFPLLILAGIRWMERPSWRRAGWLTAALGACWLTNPYYGIMGLVMVGVIVVVGAVVIARRSGLRRVPMPVVQVGIWVVLFVAVPLMLLQASSKGALDTNLARSSVELELYGARITDYLLPAADNTFFSGLVGADTWASIGSPGGERTAFVGYCTIALALIGYGLGYRRRASLGRRLRLVMLSTAPLLLVLVVFSLASPTRVLGTQITMPSTLIFDVAPYLRVFARFAAPVMAVLLVVAALGLRELIRDRSDVARYSVLSMVFVISAMELPNGAPAMAVLNSGPPVVVNGQTAGHVPTWLWLRDNRPGEIVFEQPGRPERGPRALLHVRPDGPRAPDHQRQPRGRLDRHRLHARQRGRHLAGRSRAARRPRHRPGDRQPLGLRAGSDSPLPAAGAPPEGFGVAAAPRRRQRRLGGHRRRRPTPWPIPRPEGWWDPELIDGAGLALDAQARPHHRRRPRGRRVRPALPRAPRLRPGPTRSPSPGPMTPCSAGRRSAPSARCR